MEKFSYVSHKSIFPASKVVTKSRVDSVWKMWLPYNVLAQDIKFVEEDPIQWAQKLVPLPKAPISLRMFVNGIEWFPKKGGKQ